MIVGLPLILGVTSCDFGDTNVDPSALSDATVNTILPSTEMQSARNLASIGARVTGVIMQQFTGIDSQPLGYTTYLIDESSLDDYWSTGLYAGAMKDCIIIIEKGKEQNIPQYTGIARILLALNLGIATSFWGDVPYSQAFDDDALQVPYDTQEEIYAAIQELLDDAIQDLNQPDGDIVPSTDDLIYGGKAALWIGTARALKAKYYMHVSKHDSEAAANALAILSKGTIFSNEVEPAFPFGETTNEANPIAYFAIERPNQLVVGDFMLNMLDSYDDPRKPFYTRLSSGNYVLYTTDAAGDGEEDLYWGQMSSPLPLISYSEILFLEAEIYHSLGDDTKAQEKYQAGIEANMEKIGVATADIATYLNNVGDLSLLTTEQKLQRIMEQKYLAMFGQGTLQTWVDFRRTGYPLITPPDDASESFDPSKVVPVRYLYPISERNTNNDYYSEAITRQGGHLLDDTIWAFE